MLNVYVSVYFGNLKIMQKNLIKIALIFLIIWSCFLFLGPLFSLPKVLFFMVINIFMATGFLLGLVGLVIAILVAMTRRDSVYLLVIMMSVAITPLLIINMFVPIDVRLQATNDISTNIVNPPTYYQSRDVRVGKYQVSWGTGWLEIPHNIKQHPSLATTFLDASCRVVSDRVLATVDYLGWPIYHPAKTDTTIEVTASYFHDHFNSDFLIRMVDKNLGSDASTKCALDLRSASRHNSRDMGDNILLMNRFMDAFEKNTSTTSN
jgi:hypothetical protein